MAMARTMASTTPGTMATVTYRITAAAMGREEHVQGLSKKS